MIVIIITSLLLIIYISAKSQLKKPVSKEAEMEMTPLQSDKLSKAMVEKKEELLLDYNKFHKRWMDQLSDMRTRKP